jgi:hypothetical protein
MGGNKVKLKFKTALCLLAGLAVGAALSKVEFPGYKHVMVMARKGAETKPIYIGAGGGRQVLALTVKDLTDSGDIEIRMDGAEIESWFPPVVRMPFNKDISFEDGKFTGAGPGKRLPVYVAFNDDGEKRKIEVIDSTDGSIIQTLDVLRGKGNEKQHH